MAVEAGDGSTTAAAVVGVTLAEGEATEGGDVRVGVAAELT
ncbi:MAG TPA: hypothetical protein VFJ79_08560 [Acidimicrobiales bacterium]|nr:hypothetical protein [Acidimicrobiales bacterium]